MENKELFNPGKLTSTETIFNLMFAASDYKYNHEIIDYLERHISGDFGALEECDIKANLREIKANSGRVLSRYESSKGDIYIITTLNEDPSENETKIMFCNEY